MNSSGNTSGYTSGNYDSLNMTQMQEANFQQAVAYARAMEANFLNSQEEIFRQNQKIQKLEQEKQFLKDGVYGKDVQLLEIPQEKTMTLFRRGKYYPFLEAVISSVKTFKIRLYHSSILAYIVTFETKTEKDITICFAETDLQSPKLFFNKLEKASLYVITSFSNLEKLELLRKLIYSKENKDSIFFIPYKAGWYEKKYWYGQIKGVCQLRESGIVNPYLKRYFAIVNKSAWNIEEYISDALNNPDILLLLTITAGALAYTPLKNAGYRHNALFMLDSNMTTTSSAITLMQHWAEKFYIKLSEPKKFVKSLAEFKDEVVILTDNNTEYALKISQDMNNILRNGELLNDNGFEEFNAVPILVTARSKKWQERCTKALMLPSPACSIPKECIQILWKNFCDTFASEYDFYIKEIGKIKYDPLPVKEYLPEFQWIMKAYQIFYHYLNKKRILKQYRIMTIRDFGRYIGDWLLGIEYDDYLDLSEVFITWFKDMKNKDLIKFVKPSDYNVKEEDTLIMAVDKIYIYISPTVMKNCVKKALPGKNASEVYSALVEDEYAKGESDNHMYPKVPQKAGFEKRIRMAHLKRELLLSDAELYLEVI